ncbi:aldo/keto reductase [Amycolatopsis sp. YIM 10]|uniref:aldo/keto reductase n=1 Tax=Amycolatopsis sp. YIM 10 TaxID=2653857 RepID=UPI0012A8DFAA|nr:aldo/keto reductase [Amycolatopsis sp. YIM 10]QFU89567.1 General stress protein 69 [Amycolatopsis sp. YIM 10]
MAIVLVPWATDVPVRPGEQSMNGSSMESDVTIDGRPVGPLALGCSNFGHWVDDDVATRIVHTAIDRGVVLFDTANVYPPVAPGGSERLLGRALDGRRDRVLVATKFGHPLLREHGAGAAAGTVRKSVEGSLRRLRTDWIDLYQLHKPDPDVPVGETLSALAELTDAGKVRAIGCSQFTVPQLAEAHRVARELGVPMFRTVQNEYSLLRGVGQDDVVAACEELGVAFLPFFPLAGGLLTGKYRSDAPAPPDARLTGQLRRYPMFEPSRFLEVIDGLIAYTADRGRTLVELALGWLLSRPGVACVLVGATRVEQVEENVAAASAWRMSPREMSEVAALLRPEAGFGDRPVADRK